MCSLGGPVFEVGIRTHRFYEMEDAIKLDGIVFFSFITWAKWYSSNETRKTQDEHLNILCQNLNCLVVKLKLTSLY